MDKIYLFFYKFLCFIANTIPQAIGDFIFKFIALCFYKLDRKRKRVVMANLNFCFPQFSKEKREEIARATYLNFGFFASEFLRNQKLNKAQILQKTHFVNENLLIDALKTARPIIVTTAHQGNWELFSVAMAAKFGAISVVGRKLDSAVMDEILSEKRRKFDIELIDKKGGAKDILRALKNGRILGILVDQNTAKSDGLECEFFGHKILHTPSAGILAQKTNALIICAFVRKNTQNPRDTDIVFTRIIDVKTLGENAIIKATQIQSDETQHFIAQDPSEYFWFHKKFKHFYEEIYA